MTDCRLPASAASNGDPAGYSTVRDGVVALLESARRASARAVNAMMVATYWEIGRRIVEYEQGGEGRAGYGERLIARLSQDLGTRFGRGFSVMNLTLMRRFYAGWPILQTASVESAGGGAGSEILQTLSVESALSPLPPTAEAAAGKLPAVSGSESLRAVARRFPLPSSHYVRLLSVKSPEGRSFYETEALRGGWTVRQLDRQIGTQFFERTLLSRNKAAMLRKGGIPKPEDAVTPEEEIKDPFVLEFLGLKDEYSESDLEEALIRKLEAFLLELGGDFAFIGRQRRLRVGDQWYRVDLVFFHRGLRCLVIIDLKLDKFTHEDAGKMHLYVNYARENWLKAGENPPVGLILCAEKDETVAHYALEGLENKILAAEYRMALPDEKWLADEIERTRREMQGRRR